MQWKLDDDGALAIPDEPGLGLHLDIDALASMTDDTATLKRLASA